MNYIKESGFAAIGIVAVFVLLIAIGGTAYYVLNNQSEENSSNTALNEDQLKAQLESELDSSGDVSSAPTSGDYSIENVSELTPVCSSQSFPAGITSTSSGVETVALVKEVGDEFEYASSAIPSGEFKSGYSTTEVDRVLCAEETATVAFEKPCETSGTSYTLVGKEFNVKVYDLQTQEVIGTTKLSHTDECPTIVTISGGKATASRLSGEAVSTYLSSL